MSLYVVQPHRGATHMTPEDVKPFPKAPPRKSDRGRGRKPGRCRIFTDNLEKQEIQFQTTHKGRKLDSKVKITVKKKIEIKE